MSKRLSKNDVKMMSAMQKVYCLVGFLTLFNRLLISGSRVRVPEDAPKQASVRLPFEAQNGGFLLADVVELADTLDLGSSAQAYEFESLHLHHSKMHVDITCFSF